jgi:uncharacterized membrane protein YkoI
MSATMPQTTLYGVLLPAGLILTGLILANPSLADDRHDHDRARQALEAKEILPLQTILARIERQHPGQIMEVELEREHGRWRYEIKLLRNDGRLMKLDIDARDGSILRTKSKDASSHGEPR